MNMLNTKILGNTTEMECMLECMKLGIQVSIPFGEDSRYDFIMDYDNKLYKIQCKHCSEIILFISLTNSANCLKQFGILLS